MTDVAALTAGTIRFVSGVSFLVAPEAANRFWGDSAPVAKPTAYLLLHSMGYRDALIGGMLIYSGLTGRDTRGWFLASGGADAADFLGGTRVHDQMSRSGKLIGLGGAGVGIGVGLWGGVLRGRR